MRLAAIGDNCVDFYEKQGIDRKSAMKKVAADRGVGKREIYQALLKDE